jgi:hypothetical protein
MKSFASGDLGSFKMLREIALDTGLYRSIGGPARSDLFTRLGVKSRNNGALYTVRRRRRLCAPRRLWRACAHTRMQMARDGWSLSTKRCLFGWSAVDQTRASSLIITAQTHKTQQPTGRVRRVCAGLDPDHLL